MDQLVIRRRKADGSMVEVTMEVGGVYLESLLECARACAQDALDNMSFQESDFASTLRGVIETSKSLNEKLKRA